MLFIYLRYVDDILAASDKEQDSLNLLIFLNNRNWNIIFTIEKQKHLHSTATCFDSHNSLCFKRIEKAISVHNYCRKLNVNTQLNHLALTLSL